MREWKELILWTRGNQWREPLRISDKFALNLSASGDTPNSAIEFDNFYGTTTFHCSLHYEHPNGLSSFDLDLKLVKNPEPDCFIWDFETVRVSLPNLTVKYIDPILALFAIVGQEGYYREGGFQTFINLLENFELALVKLFIHPKRDEFFQSWKIIFGIQPYGHVPLGEFQTLMEECANYDDAILSTWHFTR